MAGPVEGGGPEGTNDREETPPPLTKEHIEDLREAFAARFSIRRACFKEPYEITKIIKRANESFTAFKERWTVETGFIMGVPEVMKILSFMDSVKSLELAKRFSDKVPTTAQGRDMYLAVIPSDDRAPYPSPKGEYNQRVAPILALDSRTKRLKEILATETKLRLLIPRPMLTSLRSGNTDRYCAYHQEKGHYTNDYIQLRKQLEMEMALESRKLNHLVKDIRRGGRGPHGQDDPQPAKIINVINVNSVKDKKRKVKETTESWMNISITFSAISAEDVSEEPLIVEAGVEGYLVMRVYVDEGSEVSKPLGKIELEVCFGNGGLYMRNSMKFIVVRAPSPYNIILGRPDLKTIRAISSTIHTKMKFLTPKGVATVVTRTLIIAECRRLEKEQLVEDLREVYLEDESYRILFHYTETRREWKEAKNFVTFCFDEHNKDVEVKEFGVRLICDEDVQQEAHLSMLHGLPTPTQDGGMLFLSWDVDHLTWVW
nr:reverse transcriptase domain-containing protein [Tanacetum cinerariifolium]